MRKAPSTRPEGPSRSPWTAFLPVLVAAWVVGCGGGETTRRGVVAPPVITEELDSTRPPELAVELLVAPDRSAESYQEEIAHFTVTVRTDRAWDLAVPGPPHLRIRFTPKGEDEPLPVLRDLSRPRPEHDFPLSLEARESIVLGPMPLTYFDVDPLFFRTDVTYRIDMVYEPGEGLEPVRLTREAVLIPDRELTIPLRRQPSPGVGPSGVRPPSSLRILDPRGRVRRYMEWSPEAGFVPTG